MIDIPRSGARNPSYIKIILLQRMIPSLMSLCWMHFCCWLLFFSVVSSFREVLFPLRDSFSQDSSSVCCTKIFDLSSIFFLSTWPNVLNGKNQIHLYQYVQQKYGRRIIYCTYRKCMVRFSWPMVLVLVDDITYHLGAQVQYRYVHVSMRRRLCVVRRDILFDTTSCRMKSAPTSRRNPTFYY